jgi:hypothetical protein
MKPFDECVLLETRLDKLTEAFEKRQKRAELRAVQIAAGTKKRRRKSKRHSMVANS